MTSRNRFNGGFGFYFCDGFCYIKNGTFFKYLFWFKGGTNYDCSEFIECQSGQPSDEAAQERRETALMPTRKTIVARQKGTNTKFVPLLFKTGSNLVP